MNNKAQAVSLSNAPQIVMLLVLTVMIAGAAALAINTFEKSTCTTYYNESTSTCWTNSAGNVSAETYAGNITGDGLTSLDNLTTQIPTVGTVVGVALIIVVVVGAFAFFGRSKGL